MNGGVEYGQPLYIQKVGAGCRLRALILHFLVVTLNEDFRPSSLVGLYRL